MPEKADINDILSEIGVPGRYQMFSFFWTFTIGIISAFQTVGLAFIQADMSYRCSEAVDTFGSHGNSSLMVASQTGSDVFNNTCSLLSNSSSECEAFDFDVSMFKSTITSEFNLVCSRAKYVTISNLMYNGLGIPLGIFTGWLSDRFGRKRCTIVHLVIFGVMGIAAAFSVNIEMYIALRCLISMPAVGLYDSTNSHLSEITAPTKRPHVLIGSVISWSIAIILMTGLSYFIRDWSHLQIVISAPCLLIAIIAFWAYDESPHWLYSKGRYEEAQKVLDKMARWNKCTDKNFKIFSNTLEMGEKSPDTSKFKDISEEDDKEKSLENESDQNEEKSNGCVKILKSRRFVAIFIICSFGWLSCNLGYYGLLYGIGDLVGDLYVNNTLGGVAELIAYCLCFIILKGGRKYVYVCLGLIGGASLIGSAIFTVYLPDVTWSVITLTMIGRLCIAAAWQVLYIWCLELFPTNVRITMLQSSLTFGHVGTTLGPLMADLEKVVTNPNINIAIISPATYGALFMVSGLSALYLPETNNRPLPVTIDDALKANEK